MGWFYLVSAGIVFLLRQECKRIVQIPVLSIERTVFSPPVHFPGTVHRYGIRKRAPNMTRLKNPPARAQKWAFEDGPIVVEIPAAEDGVGIFGTLMDAWQRPLKGVGALGRDKGRGARYLLVPENYDGPLLADAFV